MILPEQTRQEFLASYDGWELDGETITKVFTFQDFVASIGFVVQVAILAERADHHPDIDIRWNKVTLALTTHDEGGLTEKDTDLAAAIEALRAVT